MLAIPALHPFHTSHVFSFFAIFVSSLLPFLKLLWLSLHPYLFPQLRCPFLPLILLQVYQSPERISPPFSLSNHFSVGRPRTKQEALDPIHPSDRSIVMKPQVEPPEEDSCADNYWNHMNIFLAAGWDAMSEKWSFRAARIWKESPGALGRGIHKC